MMTCVRTPPDAGPQAAAQREPLGVAERAAECIGVGGQFIGLDVVVRVDVRIGFGVAVPVDLAVQQSLAVVIL